MAICPSTVHLVPGMLKAPAADQREAALRAVQLHRRVDAKHGGHGADVRGGFVVTLEAMTTGTLASELQFMIYISTNAEKNEKV